MTEITVSDDLARQLAGASSPIVFLDGSGKQLGQFTPESTESERPFQVSAEFLEELQRRFENPGSYSTLEEIKARHGW